MKRPITLSKRTKEPLVLPTIGTSTVYQKRMEAGMLSKMKAGKDVTFIADYVQDKVEKISRVKRKVNIGSGTKMANYKIVIDYPSDYPSYFPKRLGNTKKNYFSVSTKDWLEYSPNKQKMKIMDKRKREVEHELIDGLIKYQDKIRKPKSKGRKQGWRDMYPKDLPRVRIERIEGHWKPIRKSGKAWTKEDARRLKNRQMRISRKLM